MTDRESNHRAAVQAANEEFCANHPELNRRQLIRHVQCRKPPLMTRQLYEMSLGVMGDDGTALLACHNATRAFARGEVLCPSIGWSNVSRTPLVYALAGQHHTFDSSRFHPSAQATSSRGAPSVFYAMFDPTDLGTDDEGDWYHFYLNAVATYHGARSQVDFDAGSRGSLISLDYSIQLAGAIDDVSLEMRDRTPSITDNDTYRGWRWANALSQLEGAKYGTDHGGGQAETTRESLLHRRGARFGLDIAGASTASGWHWYVPMAGSARALDPRVDLDSDTHATDNP